MLSSLDSNISESLAFLLPFLRELIYLSFSMMMFSMYAWVFFMFTYFAC